MDPLFEKTLISTKEAGDLSGYAPDYLSRLVRSGKIQGRRIGHAWFVEPTSLKSFIGKQNIKKVEYAKELSARRGLEYRARQSPLNAPVKKLVRFSGAPLSVRPGSRVITECTALGVASLVLVGGFYGAHSPYLSAAFKQVSTIATAASFGFATNVENFISTDVQPETTSGMFSVARERRAPAQREIVASVPALIIPRVELARVSAGGGYASSVSVVKTASAEVAHITREDAHRAVKKIVTLAIEPTRILKLLGSGYVAVGEAVYGAMVSMQTAYVSGIAAAGEGALALGSGGRDAIASLPQATFSSVENVVALNARLAWGVSETGASLIGKAIAFVGSTGDVLVTGTARLPDIAYDASFSISEFPLEYGPKVAATVFGAEMKAAQTVLDVGEGLAAGSLTFVHDAGNLAVDVRKSLERAGASLARTSSQLRASSRSALAAAAGSETELSFIQWIALSTYETVQDAVDSTSGALAALFTPTTTPPISDTAPQATSSPSVPVSTKIANAPAPPSSAIGAAPSFNTYVTGVSQEYVAASLQALRTDLSNQMIALVAPVARQTITNVTTIQQVARIESLGGLAVSQGNFTNSTFDGGTIKNVNSIGGTSGTFGTLTTGGLTATANIVANGFSSASYFTATSTSATSTFAGAFAVGTTSPFGDSFLTIGSSTPLFHVTRTNGFVGIGTSSPVVTLDIYGTDAIRVPVGTTAQRPATGDIGLVRFNTTTNTLEQYTSLGWLGLNSVSNPAQTSNITAGTDDYLRFVTTNSERMTITNNGLVGVSSTTPFAQLSVHLPSNASTTVAFAIASSTASATTTLFTVLNSGKVGIGTTSPYQLFSVSGNGYFTGGLGVGMATTTAGDLAVANNAYIGGSLTIAGNNIVLGNSSSNTLTVNSSVSSHFIPTVNAVYDLGSPSFYWDDAYIDSLSVNSISAASTTIGGTSSSDFTLNSDNATSDTEDMNLIFYRGSVVPNALLGWNSTRDRFEFNQPLYIENASSSTTIPTLALVGKAGQTGDLFNVASSSGSRYFTVNYLGNVGVGTTSPFATFAINPTAGNASNQFVVGSSTATSFIINNNGYVGVGTTSPTHTLSIVGDLNYTGTLYQNGVALGVSQWTTSGSNIYYNTGNVGIGSTSPWGLLSVNPTAANGSAPSFVVGSSTATRFIIDNGGLVGIGTSSPSTRLSVQDTVSTAQLRVAYDTTRYADLQVNSSGDLLLASQSTNIYTTDGNLFACASGACPSGTVSGTGNIIAETRVGIGTSTPSVQLDIVASTPTIRLRDSATTTGFSISQNSNGTTTLNNTANAEIVFGTNNTTRMVITQSGHVGIGTTSPTQQFSVADRLFVGANGASGLGTATSTFQGDLKITGKLDVGTIDPVYTIDGVKYATYGHSTVGIKEETVATLNLDAYNPSTRTYQHIIKFSELPKGSDLWLFYQITDFGSDWEHLVVSLTPGFDGTVSYRKLPGERVLVVESTHPGEVTARMLANRFNWREWPTLRPDQDTPNDTGFVLSSKK